MEFKKYSHISNFLNNFLSQFKDNKGVFLIPWLHFLRVHKEENADNYELNNSLYNNFLYRIIMLILKLTRNYVFYKSNDYKKITETDNIYISHIISLPEKYKYEDIYFSNDWKQKNSITLLINHTFISEKKLRNLLQDDFYLLSKHYSFAKGISYILTAIQSFFKIKEKINYETSELNKKIISRGSYEALSSSTNTNYNIREQCLDIFRIIKPKNVFFTLEGHAYERAIISAAREASRDIKCIGYQHSGFFYSQNSIFQTYSKKYDPDVVLTTGPLASEYAKKKFKNKSIKFHVVGTNKCFRSKSIKGNTCLVAPEGYLSEVELLFEFSKKLAVQRFDVNFIMRLHPRLKGSKAVRMLIRKHKIPHNMIVSNNELIEDLKISKTILYRGSTVAIQAGCMGIIPVYLKLENEITIDPLYMVGEKELKISSTEQFYDIYNDKKKIPNFKFYCNNYYVPLKKLTKEI